MCVIGLVSRGGAYRQAVEERLPPSRKPSPVRYASEGDAGDLAVVSVTLTPASLATVALLGGKTGGSPPQLLVCTWDGVVNESSGCCPPAASGGCDPPDSARDRYAKCSFGIASTSWT